MANSRLQVPKDITTPGADTFKGALVHSADYKGPEPYAGKRVMVVGFGESAVDIAHELAGTAASAHLSVRAGKFLIPRTATPQLRHHFEPFLAHSSVRRHPTHAVCCALPGVHAHRMRTGACTPMLCPIRGFRAQPAQWRGERLRHEPAPVLDASVRRQLVHVRQAAVLRGQRPYVPKDSPPARAAGMLSQGPDEPDQYQVG